MCEGGIAHALRALTAAASPFGRAGAGAAPLGARIVSVCADYLELTDEAARVFDDDRKTSVVEKRSVPGGMRGQQYVGRTPQRMIRR